MSIRTLNLSPELYDYLIEVSSRETDLQKELRIETSKDDMARMQIAPEQGQFMQLMVKLMGATSILELGTYTGYSSLAMAMALPSHGEMVCCDVSETWTSVAKRYWKAAGVDHLIDLRIAPALQTLNTLLLEGRARQFDLAFIDADKTNYEEYYELCLRLMRPGGLIMLDNTLSSGLTVDFTVQDENTRAIRALNVKLQSDKRIELSHLPIADGLTLCLKK